MLAGSGIIGCAHAQAFLERAQQAWQFEEDTDRSLATLDLDGRSGRVALDTLMAEGSRCGFRGWSTLPAIPGVTTEPISSPSSVVCVKAAESDVCDEADVTVDLDWRDSEASFADLFDQLDASAVLGVESHCGAWPTLSREALVVRKATETELALKIAELVAVGDLASSAFRSMLIDGFQCGFEARGAPRMRCTRLPSKTSNCYREEALFDVRWRDPAASLAELITQLGAAEIEGTRAVCGLPHIEGESSVRVAVPLALAHG